MVGRKRDWLPENVPLQCVATPEILGKSWVAKTLWKDSGLGKSVCGQPKTAMSSGAPSSTRCGCSRLPTASAG